MGFIERQIREETGQFLSDIVSNEKSFIIEYVYWDPSKPTEPVVKGDYELFNGSLDEDSKKELRNKGLENASERELQLQHYNVYLVRAEFFCPVLNKKE